MKRADTPNPVHDAIHYTPVPTADYFHACQAEYKGIMGPVGSGKSVACVMELFTRAQEQKPDSGGVRRTRFAIIRSTYPELISTSMKTWKDWVPVEICPISLATPITGRLRYSLADGTRVESEIIFLACDREEDVKKLKSLELTAAWINEASEIVFPIIQMAGSRVDRYPSKNRGGCTWSAVIMDTNPPDTDSWWYKLAEIDKPETFKFFKQPPAIVPGIKKDPEDPPYYVPNHGQIEGIPPAENVENHNSGYRYWLKQCDSADEQWIKVFLMGEYGTTSAGKAIYPEYNDSVHVARQNIELMGGLPLVVGLDFGLTPAAAFCQLSPRGRLLCIDELTSEDMGIRTFVRNILRPHVQEFYHGANLVYITDPAGNQRDNDETTALSILLEEGIDAQMCSTNLFKARRETVAYFLTSMRDGEPSFSLSPKCEVIRKGFNGHYIYQPRRTQTGVGYTKKPAKNAYSHPHDALQYAAVYLRGGYSPQDQASPDHFGSQLPTLGPAAREVEQVGWGAWT